MTVAEKLVALRKKAGKTQTEVADDLKISQSRLGNYEQGIRIPRDSLKKEIAEYYGVSVQDLFFS